NRATPGSTLYDAADEEPFEPGWTGATWYGASSGTYWTINPKEYADPRKHGPEYQRRARRSASGRWVIDPDPDADAAPEPTDDTRPRARAGGGIEDEAPAASAGNARSETGAGWSGNASSTSGSRPPPPPATRRTVDDGPVSPIVRAPSTATGRLGLALLGWPP